VPGFPLHKLNLAFDCAPKAPQTIVIGGSSTCTAILTDPDSFGPAPIAGTLTVSASPGGQVATCSSFVSLNANQVSCPGIIYHATQAGEFDLTASFAPTSNHVAADTLTSPVHLSVTAVPTLQVGCQGGGSFVAQSPILCTAQLQTSGTGPSALPGRTLTWATTDPGVFECSVSDAPGSCSPPPTVLNPPACITDSNGQCSLVFRSDPSGLGPVTLTITFGGDQPPVSPPFTGVSQSVSFTLTAPSPAQRHDSDVVFNGCQSIDSHHLHCQVTIYDMYLAQSPPPADQDTRSPPTGPTFITTQDGSDVRNSTCDPSPHPWPGTDHSTCAFDLVRVDEDHDEIQLNFQGDAFHSPNISSWKDIHFGG
jgi:hypothetical protein